MPHRAFCSGLLLVVAMTIAQPLHSADVRLAWDSNTEPDIAGYTVYYGQSSRSYTSSTNVGLVTTNLITGLGPGLFYFAVTAYNTNGLESDFSNEVSYQVPTNAPLGMLGLPLQLTFNKNTSAQLPFTINGASSSGSNLTLRATSSNPVLLPTKRILFQGSGTNRTLVVSPVLNKWGKVKAVVIVSDGATTITQAVAFTITASNNTPTLTAPVSLSTWKQTPLPVVSLRAGDVDAGTAPLRLTLTAAHGTLKLLTTVAGGITSAQVQGNGSSRCVITAPVRAINRTLSKVNGLVYRRNLNFVGNESVTALLNDRGNTGVGGAKRRTVSIPVDVQGDAYDYWRTAHFNESDLRTSAKQQLVWGDNADPDNDGRDNLMEFALGSEPYVHQSSTNGLFSALVDSSGSNYLSLTFVRRLNQSVLNYVPEVSPDGLNWSSDAAAIELLNAQPLDAYFETITVRDRTSVAPEQMRFMRLRVLKNP